MSVRSEGVIIRHVSARNQLCLVELRDRPYYLSIGDRGVADGRHGRPLVPAPIKDCSCGVVHEYKTLHIHVDGSGSAIISVPMVDTLRAAGETGFFVVSHTTAPPTIRLGQPREKVDYDNRKYQPLTPIRPKAST